MNVRGWAAALSQNGRRLQWPRYLRRRQASSRLTTADLWP